ncbi:MAG: YdjY domain-containing protein [Pirellulales bacterium]
MPVFWRAAQPGNPATFQPEFKAAKGTEIEVLVEWKDASGKTHKVDARQWIKASKTGKPMDYPWVFGGSGFWTDPADGKRYYQAEDGDFICISNFPSAMLDVPVESSAANSSLLFEAFTDHIPPEKTRVTIYLVPKLDAKAKEAAPEKKAAGQAS